MMQNEDTDVISFRLKASQRPKFQQLMDKFGTTKKGETCQALIDNFPINSTDYGSDNEKFEHLRTNSAMPLQITPNSREIPRIGPNDHNNPESLALQELLDENRTLKMVYSNAIRNYQHLFDEVSYYRNNPPVTYVPPQSLCDEITTMFWKEACKKYFHNSESVSQPTFY
jgi:hypothetical protein